MASIMWCLLSVLLFTSQHYRAEAKLRRSDAQDELPSRAAEIKPDVYVVYMGGVHKTTTTNNAHLHGRMLHKALGETVSIKTAADSILYSYTKSFNGFSAAMSASHAEKIRGMDGVVSVFKSGTMQLHTTRSWEYLGLNPTKGVWPETSFGNNTIIGLLDTGIWPESESFKDDGFGPIPSRWNGSCESGDQFDPKTNCNKKLIGAKFYAAGYEAVYGNITAPEYKSPRDAQGHGSHTSSTSGGRQVSNASFLGVGNGTASGGAPLARLAMYKVCWIEGCTYADILAAFEDAISDKVDILSISLGGSPDYYYEDTIAIGAFHAVAQGIVVACSAGNSGPSARTVSNLAPWIFTVGASTTDRNYRAALSLTGGPSFNGSSINTFKMNNTTPIVYGGYIPASGSSPADSAICDGDSLDPVKANGSIIVCQGANDGIVDEGLIALGALGYVTIVNGENIFETILPQTSVDLEGGTKLLEFINTTTNPTAIISPSFSVFDTTPAPIMAYFSSVGPNLITPDILKPDITAPGVDIIAAWAPPANPTEEAGDTRQTNFNIISGTSMSCPHLAGTIALVKSLHPKWSAAAIKSAIMTTATPLNTSILGNDEFASGAGQISPSAAVDPGLIFETSTEDYTIFLCSSGYTDDQVYLVTGYNYTCPENPPAVLDLNYPSIYISILTNVSTYNVTRTLTNVGPAAGPANYSATLTLPPAVEIEIVPTTLQFLDINDKQSFKAIVTTGLNFSSVNGSFGSVIWSDGVHSVRVVIGLGDLESDYE